jgi:electron-transferring-flavoprotein dehydrogenase
MNDFEVDRQTIEMDIVCVGFGPATAGFLHTLSKTPDLESRVAPGMPLQVACYERAEDIGFGVSGVVTRARGIRASLPEIDAAGIPMAARVIEEKLVYLLDPVGASRRSQLHRVADALIRPFASPHAAIELPYIPPAMRKDGGLVMSVGQFLQFVGGELMGSGTVQIWPGTPVAAALMEQGRVVGLRLTDQGVDREGRPEASYLPGMDVRAALTVVGDGPVGAVGQQLDLTTAREWALGMKMVIDLPEGSDLPAGTVLHTFGFPEPEIFGFLYVHPERVASAGIFVPSWFRSATRTGYRYLQRFLMHPYIWRYVKGGRMRSWGAKSLQESGRRGEPALVLDGCARIGEGSGSTNPLAGSGVDEAWTTGAQLAQGVVELLKAGKPLTRENLENTYVARRRASWVDREARIAERARDGFHRGFFRGLAGMALAGFTHGRLSLGGVPRPMTGLKYETEGRWPDIPYDGQLLVSHQDALLMGGKVQAPPGFADHVRFLDPAVCVQCNVKLCVEMCSGQAITRNGGGVPAFDREKCVHCGACLWNCPDGVVAFQAGAGGLHSNEN